jgi:PAS domain S-box-containing protein
MKISYRIKLLVSFGILLVILGIFSWYLHQMVIESKPSVASMLYFSLFVVSVLTAILYSNLRRYYSLREQTAIEVDRQVKEQLSSLLTSNDELQHEIAERKRAEELIIISEVKYRHTLDAMIEGCQIIGFDWRYLYINDPAARQGHYSKEELLGYTMMEKYPGIENTEMFEKLQFCMNERIPQFMENKFTYPDGSIGCFDLKIQPIEEGIFILSLDISERKRAEEELRKSESLFVEMGKLANIGGWELNLQTMELFWTPQTYKIYGIENSCMPSIEDAINFYAPEARPIITDAVNLGISEGKPWDVELPFINAKGENIWVRTLGTGEFHDGKCIRMYGAFQDITERKLIEEEMRKNQEQFRMISENVADMIAVLDLDGKRIYNSPSYRQILGDPETLQGTDSFQDIHPEDREKIRGIFQDTVKTGIGHRAEYRFLLKDGTSRFIESQGSIIRNEEGNVSRIIVVSRDITDKKKLEQQFLRAQRMESIGTLAGGIAHDLNNVLAPIMLSVNYLRTKLTDPNSAKMLQMLEASTKRGSELIKQVLSFARGVEGEFTIVEVRHIVEEIGKIITQTFPKSISFRTTFSTTLTTVLADATQIHQVLMNLCVNARDAMPNGGRIEIQVETITLDEQYIRMHLEAKIGTYLVITVSDQGMGIPPAILERIFEPFFTTKETGKGTGLGLSTVIAITKSHGGFVNVYSEVGKGTTFKIYLPIREEIPSIQKEANETMPTQNTGLILVVDDEASIREITQMTLESYGYSVIIAADGTEAITEYARHNDKIALVITDMMMPYMDGATTIRALQKMNPNVKVIAVSGLKQNADIVNQDSVVFLHKPYTSEKLLSMIDTMLHEK